MVQPKTAEESISIIEEIMNRVLSEITTKLPSDAQNLLKNIEFVVLLEPTEELRKATGDDVEAAFHGYPFKQPAVIYLFAGMHFRHDYHFSEEKLYQQVRKNILHEIGHYFGMNHDQLRRAGLMNE